MYTCQRRNVTCARVRVPNCLVLRATTFAEVSKERCFSHIGVLYISLVVTVVGEGPGVTHG